MAPLLLFLATRAAFAHEPAPAFCQPAEAIRARLQVCYDNRDYAASSALCYRKFHELVVAATAEMKAPLARDSGQQQLRKLADTASDYALTAEKLRSLLTVNRAAEAELGRYLASLVIPFDRRSLMEVPCFGDNADRIRNDIAGLLDDRDDLEAALAAAETNLGKATVSGAHLEARGAAARAVAGSAQPARRPAARPGSGASDITGTMESKRKEAKP